MISKAARKYFESYATPDPRKHIDISKSWDRAVVIPAWRETETLKRSIRSIEDVAQQRMLRTLVIVVLNGAPEDRESRLSLARELNSTNLEIAPLSPYLDLQILFLDRPSVGMARKTGMDLAARLFFEKRLLSPWLRTTDADVSVHSTYLDDPSHAEEISTELFNFVHLYHELSDSAAEAHCIYDIFLRYYVLGLEYAGSAYAFHSLGSIISVHAESYVAVRGFQDRDAAEDFYLLNKLAKVGRIQTRSDSPLQIEGRLSDRVPFGTGRGVTKILETRTSGSEHEFYDPQVFEELKTFIDLIHAYAESKDASLFENVESKALQSYIEEHSITQQMAKLPLQSQSLQVRKQQVTHWFDGFRVLKFVHYMRDRFYSSLSWQEALRNAPFLAIQGPIETKSLFEVGRQLESARVENEL